MKKIRNIEQLRLEKQRLHQEQQELEAKMRSNLSELKVLAAPVNLVKEAVGNAISRTLSPDGSSISKGLLVFGASLLARKLAGKLIGKVLKK